MHKILYTLFRQCTAKRFQVAVVYRFPSVPIRQFVQFMTRLLRHLSECDVATIVLVDVNDDVLSNSGSA